jgi:ABC-type uncharacterized transport system fused permease/ATPase subunit
MWQQTVISGSYFVFTIMLFCVLFFWIKCQTELKLKYWNNIDELMFESYKKLQVFEKILNPAIRNRIFPVIALYLPVIQLVLGFVVIKLFHSIDSPDSENISFLNLRTGLFLFIYVMILSFNLILGTAASKINTLSKSWINKTCKRNCKSKLTRKMAKSLLPLRLYFGSNYMSNLTPLKIQDFTARRTITSLLVLK